MSKPKGKRATNPPTQSPWESSDDDLPLRSAPTDTDIKSTILEFLKGQDLSLVTRRMVKEALRTKYGEAAVRSKKEAIARGIEEGMAIS